MTLHPFGRWLAIFSVSLLAGLSQPESLAQDPGLRGRLTGPALARHYSELDGNDPWSPRLETPRLITPQWVGEEGVEAVVILAIDDMRDPPRYEGYLRPILNRLKEIDGRAPVSIMTCDVKSDDPQVAQWIGEGLSIEIHTVDHPCPLLSAGDLAKAKSTYDRCIDQMFEIPGNSPVAFRMPCCDSLNTVSPRFFSEIFTPLTPGGHHLAISSSVCNVFTSNDPSIPRELIIDADGGDRFLKYTPRALRRGEVTFDTFVNTIENHPYPYVVNGNCWEFPCVTPSDWSAQHRQQVNNPVTLDDWKAALDITVLKQGVFCLVFHPHGWIQNSQVVELIDHAVQKHGNRVRFLNFREAHERMTKTLFAGGSLRDGEQGGPVRRVLDVNGDGYLDVVSLAPNYIENRLWMPAKSRWSAHLLTNVKRPEGPDAALVPRFGRLNDGRVIAAFAARDEFQVRAFQATQWQSAQTLGEMLGLTFEGIPLAMINAGLRFRDFDHDGTSELILGLPGLQGVWRWTSSPWRWVRSDFSLPSGLSLVDEHGRDAGLRFVDIDEDGLDDIVFSNPRQFGVYLMDGVAGELEGWTRTVIASERGIQPAERELPPIVRADGSHNGFFVHSRHLFWQNEETDKLLDLVDRRSFNEILSLSDAQPRGRSPLAAEQTLRARPGFQAQLVAAEPLVKDPVAIAWGADGRLWVAEMGDYPLGANVDEGDAAGGRICWLADIDGDGVYDQRQLFLKVPYPNGVHPWKNGVLISAAPDILYAEDTDGDGVADVREVLYTGFVEGNQQHRVNGFAWGLDNWLYLANGDSGGVVRSLKTGKEVNISGRDIRIHPESGDIDTVTGQTQFGRNRDDWGNWFGCNNANPMYHFVLDDRYQRRNPYFASPNPRVDVPAVPGTAPVFPLSRLLERFNDYHTANRFTSACSTIVYRDDLFGPHFAGNAFISEPVHNLVHRDVMRPEGLSFRSQRAVDEDLSEFLASSDNWFRPTMLRAGPEGALWVTDMYRHVIEHPQWIPDTWQKRLDLRAGHDRGRIWRVLPVAVEPREVPLLGEWTTSELVEALDSPSGWQRDFAQQLIIERNDRSVAPLLNSTVIKSVNPLARLHALCTLDGLKALTPPAILRGLADPHPGVRRHAIRLVETLTQPSEPVIERLAALAADPDPQVRLQLAATLGEVHDARAHRALAQLLATAGDNEFQFAAAMSSIRRDNVNDILVAVLAETGGAAPEVRLIEELLNQATSLGDDRALETLLSRVVEPRDGQYEAWQFSAVGGLLDSLDRQKKTLESLTENAGDALRGQLAQLMHLFAAGREFAADPVAPVAQRQAALRVVGRDTGHASEDLELLDTLLTPQADPLLQQTAIATLGRSRADEVADRLLTHWGGLGPERKSEALDVLFSRPAWRDRLIQALRDGAIDPAEFDAARRQQLLEQSHETQRAEVSRLLSTTLDVSRQEVIERFREATELAGDATRGRELFSKLCAQCHKLGGTGHEVGPDLAALTDKSPESLLTAILDPNRAVERKFIAYVAQTRAGRNFSGLLASETGNSITLRGPEGRDQVLLRADLEELVSTRKSAMPEGLEQGLTPASLADLIAHIRSNVPLPKRKEFPGNSPHLITAAADGALLLPVDACEIYGTTLVLEEGFKNLGYWSSLDDHAVWTVDAPRSGTYRVAFDWACHEACARNVWRLESPVGTVTGTVGSTGTWENYQQADVGELPLRAGKQRIVMRAAQRVQGAMIDLKAIRLTPLD